MSELTIVHISDTHGARGHSRLTIPECNVLIHSGDIGGRTTLFELVEFLTWFEKQPADVKIFSAGNHDLILDFDWVQRQKKENAIQGMIAEQQHNDALEYLKKFNVVYLNNEDYIYKGIKFYGSPITPSFHRKFWAFNADRGEEIQQYWDMIPSDVDVLITHGPPYGILDAIPEGFKQTPNEDIHRGCEDLLKTIRTRLHKLKLSCFGHIHDGPNGLILKQFGSNRFIRFSNGSVLDNDYELVVPKPLLITL